jgi:hypothetical protein
MQQWEGLIHAAAAAVDGFRCSEYSPALRETFGVRYWSLCMLSQDAAAPLRVLVLAEEPLNEAIVGEQLRRTGVHATGLTWHRDRETCEWRGELVTAPPEDTFRYYAHNLRPSGDLGEIVVRKGDTHMYYDSSLARWDRGELSVTPGHTLISRQSAERLARQGDSRLPGEDALTELTSTYHPARS